MIFQTFPFRWDMWCDRYLSAGTQLFLPYVFPVGYFCRGVRFHQMSERYRFLWMDISTRHAERNVVEPGGKNSRIVQWQKKRNRHIPIALRHFENEYFQGVQKKYPTNQKWCQTYTLRNFTNRCPKNALQNASPFPTWKLQVSIILNLRW